MTAVAVDWRERVDLFEDLVSTVQAAELAGVEPGVVRQWAARGYLRASARDVRGWPLYRPIDVARAEGMTRARALRESRRAARLGRRS